MDKISFVGLILGVSAILVGQILEGGHLGSLLQPTAFMIVMGGTIGAVMLQSPFHVFRNGIAMGKWVFMPQVPPFRRVIDQVIAWSHTARKEGLLALEDQALNIKDPFTARGLQLLVDGIEPDKLREVMEVEIDAWEA